jgi:hypothetical protein
MSKPTLCAIAAFSGILLLWAAANLLLAESVNTAPQSYPRLLMAAWVIGLGVAVFAASMVYRHLAADSSISGKEAKTMRFNWAGAGITLLVGLIPIAYIVGHGVGSHAAFAFTGEVLEGAMARQAMGHEVVRAQRFELVDADGRPMAVLDSAKDSRAVFLLLDEDGERRIRLAVTEKSGPALEMVDSNGKYRLGLGLGKNGRPSIEFLDETGETVTWSAP